LVRVVQARAMQGDTLVFLPGWDEIASLKERLESSASPFSAPGYAVLPLHSQIAPEEQRRVFADMPHSRKLILATNIAETALTIDGVVCVINSGRVKEKRYDPYAGVGTLQSMWITKASEKQRRGRAGRTRTGIAFHLYSQQRSKELQARTLSISSAPCAARTPRGSISTLLRSSDCTHCCVHRWHACTAG
jgi:ATP-dependent RNA helicase DHX36